MRLFLLSAFTVITACSGSDPVDGVCCTSLDNCAELKLDELRPCKAGQACVDHLCVVPACATNGCQASAPVCSFETAACSGCRDAADCSTFGAADVCEPTSGACVECIGASDCEAGRPVCDAGSCRQCKLDTECASGACGEDGRCVAEAAIVYLTPTGIDTGLCTRAAPCVGWGFAFSKTSTSRSHIVMATGPYSEEFGPGGFTDAASVTVHGGGSTMTFASAEHFFNAAVPTLLRDLTITTDGSSLRGPVSLDRVKVTSRSGPVIETASIITIRDSELEAPAAGNPAISMSSGANVTIDRARIRGGRNSLASFGAGVNVKLTNVLVHGASQVALNLPMVAGTIDFSTITDSGSAITSGTRMLVCSPELLVRSSILWDLSVPPRAPISGGCTVQNVIAGPAAVAGAMNIDPVFVDVPARDFHIAPNSPAKDLVDVGPALDFEGDVRPRGARFDIGADEAP
ncbi:MAG: hypothetical protein KIT31_15760 [Deltaproteobacteria bacterium]|nr:hypothetical protein [Deltaproteobacteria bacterium]